MTETTATPPVMRAAWVNRPVDEAFSVFTEEIGAWWPLPTHGIFGDEAGSVSFRDGNLIEASRDGSEATWGEVLVWEPPLRLVLAWHPGSDATEASEVEVVFASDGGGTRVVIEHRGWETFGADATHRRFGYVGPNAWGYVLDHFGDVVETRPDALDPTELEAAYERFFAEAEQGDFGPPPESEWDAAQTIAHVALNDAAMVGVVHRIVHQKPARFENEISQDIAVLNRYIRAAGGLPSLIERGRTMARLVTASLRRLSPEQRQTEVHCCLSHDGETMIDRPVPWESVAVTTQANVHLPAHVEQLRNLRRQSDPAGGRP